MKTLTQLSLSFISMTITSGALATTLLISDIDDTLKRTNVLGSALREAKTNNSFVGLSELLRVYACETSGEQKDFCFNNAGAYRNRDREVTYVSGAAPGKLTTLSREFIAKAKFPTGLVLSREAISEPKDVFKEKKIVELVKNVPSSLTILVGDNGEKDIEVYSKITKSFPEKNIKAYVHQLYSAAEDKSTGTRLKQGQKAFLTAMDLGLHMLKDKLITEKSFSLVAKVVLSHLRDEQRAGLVIPKWVRCHEFTREYERPSVDLTEENLKVVSEIEKLSSVRCESFLN